MQESTTSGTITKRHLAETEEGVRVYRSSFQLPYSPYTLYLKVFETGFIFFRLSERDDAAWVWWEGNKHNYHILKRDMTPFISKWQREQAEALVEQFMALTYQASQIYFNQFTLEDPHES